MLSLDYMKTFALKKSEIQTDWLLIDCNNLILGRIASNVANFLKGKHKTTYSPHVLCGDKVVLINAKGVLVTGNKFKRKIYYRHTGYFGGLKETTYKDAFQKDCTWTMRKAVERMLNKCPLRKRMLRNLYIYEGTEHEHVAQNPKLVSIA